VYLLLLKGLGIRLVTSDTHGNTGCVGYTDNEYNILFAIFLILCLITIHKECNTTQQQRSYAATQHAATPQTQRSAGAAQAQRRHNAGTTQCNAGTTQCNATQQCATQ
jgi:hypothetical protein